MSHLSFVTSCLREHLVPRGLKVTVTPLVPGIKCLKNGLQRKWETTLNRTSFILLKHLRSYHQDAVEILTRKINSLEIWLRRDQNFAQELERIQRSVQKWTTTQEKRKKGKMSRLMKNKPTKGRRRRQKKENL